MDTRLNGPKCGGETRRDGEVTKRGGEVTKRGGEVAERGGGTQWNVGEWKFRRKAVSNFFRGRDDEI